jgi:hypothetical protein
MGRIGCPETSVTTNRRYETSQKGEDQFLRDIKTVRSELLEKTAAVVSNVYEQG